MFDIWKDIGLLFLGAIIAFVADRLSEQYKQRKQKRDTLERLENMLATIKQAVDHGHDFNNKSDWYAELDSLANKDRDWLGPFYEPLKRIAWRIRDQSFDHSMPDAADYCCDELIVDLTLLQLKLLPLIPMKSTHRSDKENELAGEAVLCLTGALLGDISDHAEKFLKDWGEEKINLDEKYAMSSVLGKG